MKLVVLTDIHANLEAFKAILNEIGTINPDRIISLGDNVGYGADPEQVMLLLKQTNIESVLGNHEFAVVNEKFINWFNPTAQIAVNYTKTHLSPESVATIKTYKKSLVIHDIRFVHGAPPNAVSVYLFQLSDEKLMRNLDKMDEMICFAGHTHDLGLIEYDGKMLSRKPLKKGITQLSRDYKYIVNTGSVGQPRDGDNSAKFILFDTETYSIDVRYVPYDFKVAAGKIIDAGLPVTYADKLY